jgi:hypothetical protein
MEHTAIANPMHASRSLMIEVVGGGGEVVC